MYNGLNYHKFSNWKLSLNIKYIKSLLDLRTNLQLLKNNENLEYLLNYIYIILQLVSRLQLFKQESFVELKYLFAVQTEHLVFKFP